MQILEGWPPCFEWRGKMICVICRVITVVGVMCRVIKMICVICRVITVVGVICRVIKMICVICVICRVV